MRLRDASAASLLLLPAALAAPQPYAGPIDPRDELPFPLRKFAKRQAPQQTQYTPYQTVGGTTYYGVVGRPANAPPPNGTPTYGTFYASNGNVPAPGAGQPTGQAVMTMPQITGQTRTEQVGQTGGILNSENTSIAGSTPTRTIYPNTGAVNPQGTTNARTLGGQTEGAQGANLISSLNNPGTTLFPTTNLAQAATATGTTLSQQGVTGLGTVGAVGATTTPLANQLTANGLSATINAAAGGNQAAGGNTASNGQGATMATDGSGGGGGAQPTESQRSLAFALESPLAIVLATLLALLVALQ